MKEKDRETCICAIRERHPGFNVEEFGQQGFCSFTLLISSKQRVSSSSNESSRRTVGTTTSKLNDEAIVQLRPSQYDLDINIAHAAKETYSSLAPIIQHLDISLPGNLRAYEMERLHGTPFSHLQPQSRIPGPGLHLKQKKLMTSFADIIAHSWRYAQSPSRYQRADSPMQMESNWLSQCTGKVGASIEHRLEMLARELQDPWLKGQAKTTMEALRCMAAVPIVLNHGDLIPSNILVDEDTWEITGLVDWAEAEYLPFGTCLYGLEHMLGYISSLAQPSALLLDNSSSSNRVPSFFHYDCASALRDIFWARLRRVLPWLDDRMEDVQVVRNMGVLLWYGIAWDDGAISRVVNEVDDVQELACLRAFLNAA